MFFRLKGELKVLSFFFLSSVVFQSEFAEPFCSRNACPLMPCDFGGGVHKVCPNNYLKHPCLCCPICLPISQQNCALNCTNVFCKQKACTNGSYKVPGICCEECL
ncbi:UNVERIFIED_CONTAM: hypothetical protein RMT77_003464 [Armadillidium vulgare]